MSNVKNGEFFGKQLIGEYDELIVTLSDQWIGSVNKAHRIARSLSPMGDGKDKREPRGHLKDIWGVSVGTIDFTDRGPGKHTGPDPFPNMFLHNAKMYGSYVELGTSDTAPQPMLNPALKSIA